MANARPLFPHTLRRHTRFVTAFEAELTQGEQCCKVTIGDISASGALIKGALGNKIRRAVGTHVRLKAAGLDTQARIMWAEDDLCGVCFSSLVDPLAVVRENMPFFQFNRKTRQDHRHRSLYP